MALARANGQRVVLFLCVPNALSQAGGYAGERRRGSRRSGRWRRRRLHPFRRAAQSAFNLVYEIRP
jgi:hypothetical protein